jgi:hypothetical protein
MQYLLSEEEMTAIRNERTAKSKLPTLEGLINVVQHAACNMIDTRPPNGRKPETQPHGCIHVKDVRGPAYQTQYCDGCSMAGICPQFKEWSK